MSFADNCSEDWETGDFVYDIDEPDCCLFVQCDGSHPANTTEAVYVVDTAMTYQSNAKFRSQYKKWTGPVPNICFRLRAIMDETIQKKHYLAAIESEKFAPNIIY